MGVPHFALLRFVWQGYNTTPICKNQFVLETSAFPLSFWYVILTEKRDGKPVPYAENRKGWGRYGIAATKTESFNRI